MQETEMIYSVMLDELVLNHLHAVKAKLGSWDQGSPPTAFYPASFLLWLVSRGGRLRNWATAGVLRHLGLCRSFPDQHSMACVQGVFSLGKCVQQG